MATPQTGIFAQGSRSHRHLEFDLVPGATPESLRAILGTLHQPSVSAGGANIVVGFGADLWRRVTPSIVPDALGPFPDVDSVPVSQHDLWVWIHGSGEGLMFDLARGIAALLSPIATLASEVAGFVYREGRDLTGFIDGTENPPLEEAFAVAVVGADEPGAGGSFAITQRWVHDLAAFHALTVSDQEKVIGRTKADSVELDDKIKGPRAHISRVVIEQDGEELQLWRRSVPYGTVTDHGLFFVAFSADPSRFEKMLRSMFGQTADGVRDRLTEFSTPAASAAYFVPSFESLAEALA